MKPTISNAFNDGPGARGNNDPGAQPEAWEPTRGEFSPDRERPAGAPGAAARRNPRRSLAASLAPLQADLREAAFGWSLELSPIHAIDALHAVQPVETASPELRYLVCLEQSTWRGSEGGDMPIATIAQRLSIPVVEQFDDDHLVLELTPLRQLVSLCQPSRLLVVAVDGPIERSDALAMNRAIAAGQSPLEVELRAAFALEVLGDRAAVLHCRDKNIALAMTADNFRHYLAALRNRPATCFAAPEPWQIERLLSLTGALTVRPIETQMYSTSVDVGINTSRERFTQPADQSLIYDIPSDTWHDEP